MSLISLLLSRSIYKHFPDCFFDFPDIPERKENLTVFLVLTLFKAVLCTLALKNQLDKED
jgi:hypothetical protein